MPILYAVAAALFAFLPVSGLLVSGPAAADEPSGAMTFTLRHSDAGVLYGEGSKDYIFADGDITGDTPAALQQYLDQHPPTLPHTTIVLNSPGGDLEAGLAIGRLIRKYKLWTQVGSILPTTIGLSPTVPVKMIPYLHKPSAPPFAGYCYSSCTFAFLGGVFRFVDYGSDYGVHRFSFDSSDAVADVSDQAQQMSGELVQYVVDMGVNAEFVTQMSLKGPSDINHLTMQQLSSLRVITPRWSTTWRISAAADGSGFFLGGWTADDWGLHEVRISCAPLRPTPASGVVKSPPQPGLFLEFALEPGDRGNAEDLVKTVQSYVLELDAGSVTVPDNAIVKTAAAVTSTTNKRARIAVTIKTSRQFVNVLLQSNHIGFAYLFDPAANLPLRLVQFEADLNPTQLKKFVGTCH